MNQRKGLILSVVLLFGILFFAFKKVNWMGNDIPVGQKQQLLAAVGSILKNQHYSPQPIDDNFSQKVFKKFIEELDSDKSHFLQSDIDAFKKYEKAIDDEILEKVPIQFVGAVGVVYEKRIQEVMGIYKSILLKPFDFTKEESAVMDGAKLTFLSNTEELKERWRQKLKLYTLERYVDLLDQREKNKSQKDFVVKADSTLEREARERVLKVMNENYTRIQKTFKDDDRFHAFLNVVTNTMDPHSDYFPPVEKRAFDEKMSGKFYGIGAQLTKDDYGIKIASVITGGAAWKSGEIVANDVITKVAQGNGEPVDVTGFDTQDAVKLIRGNKGTEVRLTIKKQDGTYKVVGMLREEVVQDEGYARSAVIQNGNEKIGYIWLPDFYSDFEDINGHHCSEDVAQEVIKLKNEQVNGIVIDVRFNGGGSLYEVVKMVGLFIKSGPVVQVKERSGKVDNTTWRDNDDRVLYDGPLAVMVNEFSASASEIFAGAIQDYKRGIIIGSTSTYGKGTVQRQIPFGNRNDQYSGRTDMGAMTLTFQKFYRVNGGSTQLKGIVPDVIFPDPYEYFKGREKDNETALPYDEIPKISFQPWQNHAALAATIQQENLKIKQNATLNLLNENLQWLAKNAEEPITLNLVKFKERQKKINATVTQNNSLLKLKEDMSVSALKADEAKFYHNSDTAKGERYQSWLKALKSDKQIDATVGMVKGLIQSQVVTVSKN